MPVLTRTVAPFALLILLAAAAVLSGCQRPAPEAAAAPAAPAIAPDALKVAFVYIGPVGDGGWTFAHDQARRNLEAEYGERIHTSYVENVAEGPAAEQVFRDLALQGNRLIFGTTFGYGEVMHKVAREFPNVKFAHATGEKTADNLAVYEARTYEGAYLAGILAAHVSKSKKLGFVASLPIPEVYRNINAFTLGARSVDPDMHTDVVWVGAWFDPAKERSAALELIARGADVLIQNTDSPEVLKAAQEKGKHAFGWDSDMTLYGPKAHLGSVAIDWAPYYKKLVGDLLGERWKPGATWGGVRQNMIRIASPNPGLSQDLLLYLGEKSHAMRSGALQVFHGPIADSEGRIVVPAGVALDDAALKEMKFLVQGVTGKRPAG